MRSGSCCSRTRTGAGSQRSAGSPAPVLRATTSAARSSAGDIDNDGDIDLVVTNNGGAPEVLRNAAATPATRSRFDVVGSRSNRDGLGARVTVTAGGRTQVREVKSGSSYLGQNDLRVQVGLGEATRVERIDVRWPGGRTETIRDVAVESDRHDHRGAGHHRTNAVLRSVRVEERFDEERWLRCADRSRGGA